MQIKRPRDLELRDLLRIESPTFAPSNLPLDTGIASPSLHRALDLADDYIGSPYRSDSERMDRLKGKLRDGSLVLVKGTTDTPPFSPLIAWEEDGVLPGRWKVVKDVHGLNLASWVARMNDWQITPEQVERLGPGSVGHLSADSFDSDLREQRAAERERVQQDSQKNLSLPVGAAAGVAPLVAQASSTSKKESVEKKLHIEAGIFTDGTLNNAENSESFREKVKAQCQELVESGKMSRLECEQKLAVYEDTSYTNSKTNVAKLRDLYPDEVIEQESSEVHRFQVYSEGVGTTTGSEDSGLDSGTGLGDTGVISQVNRAISNLARRLANIVQGKTIDSLTIDLFGFSRGSAAARHISNEVANGEQGLLGVAFSKVSLQWPKEVSIRFAGLFDTVAGIVNILHGDIHASDEDTAPVNVYLDPDFVKSAVHLVARDECRENFALNSLYDSSGKLPGNFREITVPGVHSDVGGGYWDESIEKVLLHPILKLTDERTARPEQTMEWDNLSTERKWISDEHWVGRYSLPLPSGEAGRLEIELDKDSNPPPYGTVALKLIMERKLKGKYATINLQLMHSFARESGVPLTDLDPEDTETQVPSELENIYHSLKKQITSGKNQPRLSDEEYFLLKQRYIHHSDNYNPISFSSRFRMEMPFSESIAPLRPTSNRQRIIHPNDRNA